MMNLEKEKENTALKQQFEKLNEEYKNCKNFKDTTPGLLKN